MKKSIDRFEKKYSYLSNVFNSALLLDDEIYPTVEHAFQASKSFNSTERKAIRICRTPSQAKRLGNKVKDLMPNWDDLRVDVMYDLVYQKFEKHEDLKLKLFETEDRELIEGNFWGDSFWGVCNKKGENNLGKILMKVREKLLNKNLKKIQNKI